MNASDPAFQTSFTDGTRWSDSTAPHSGASYSIASGRWMRTPTTGSPTFSGDSLTLGDGTANNGYMTFCGPSSGTTVTVSDLRMNYGSVDTSPQNSSFFLAGGITLQGGGGYFVQNSNNQTIYVSASVGGTGGLTAQNFGTALSTGGVVLTGTNNYQGGTTVATKAVLEVRKDAGLGTGDILVATNAQLQLDSAVANNYMNDNAKLSLTDTTSTVQLGYAGVDTIRNLSFDGGTTLQAAGTWGSLTSVAAHKDSHFTGNGIVNVGTKPLIYLTAFDAGGTSSFDTSGHWSDGAAPSSSADYWVTSLTGTGVYLRTPTGASSATFGGNSLTVGDGGATTMWMSYFGTTTGSVTVNDLRLNNGGIEADIAQCAFTVAGNVTLQAGGGVIEQNAAERVVYLSANVSGVGALTVQESGPTTTSGGVVLTGTNSYQGGTTVATKAVLEVRKDGGLGTGNVLVATNAQLQLDSATANNYINDSAKLSLTDSTSSVQLGYASIDNIGSLSFDGGSTLQATGTWGSLTSIAAHKDSRFTGNGLLNVGPSPLIYLTANDASGSSFNTAGHWSDGQTPTGNADYWVCSIAGSVWMRTPVSAASATFAGQSLTVGDGTAANLTLSYSGANTGTVTINDLRLNNGVVENAKGSSNFTLAGNVTLQAGGGVFDTIDATRTITVSAPIGGPGGLNKVSLGTLTLSGVNTYTGATTVNDGKLILASTGSLLMDINPTGPFTQLLGTGGLDLEGSLKFDVTDVTGTSGSWNVVASTLSTTYGAGFSLVLSDGAAFSGSGGLLTCVDNGKTWTFSEGSGVLSVSSVPEPGTLILLATGLIGLLAYAWRKRK